MTRKTYIPRSYTKELHSQLRLFIPFLIGQLSACAMGTVDTLMAGWAGTVDLSGVSLGCVFYWPAYLFLAGIAYAVTPTTTHNIAKSNFKLMHQSLFNALVIILCFALVTAYLLYASHYIFDMLGTDKAMSSIASKYLFWVSLSLPATAIYNGYKSFVEGLSIAKPTLYIGILQIILDIPLNYIFIFGKFGMPALGGEGCGLTSCFINFVCCITIYVYTKKSKRVNAYAVKENTKKFDLNIIKQYLKLSIPLGVARTIEIACFSLAALILSPFGPTVVAAHSITLNVSSMIFTIPLCIGMTASIRSGLAIGKRDWTKATIALKTSLILNLVTFTIYFTCILSLRHSIACLYTDDTEVLNIATFLMIINCFYMLPDSLQTVFGGVLQGIKDSKTILINTIVSYWIVGLPLGYVLAWGVFGEQLKASGIWYAFICALCVACTIYGSRVLYIFKTRKLPKLLEQSSVSAD